MVTPRLIGPFLLGFLLFAAAHIEAQAFSDDGACKTPWRWRNPLPHGNRMGSICYGNGMFVTGDMTGIIRSSSNGAIWTVRRGTGSGGEKIYDMAWNGVIFLGCGKGGLIYSSPDGISWDARSSGFAEDFSAVIWDGVRFVAAGYARSRFGDGVIWTSADGAVWEEVFRAQNRFFLSVAFSGSSFVAVGGRDTPDGTEDEIYYSKDALSWQEAQAGVYGSNITGVMWDGARFVAVNSAGAVYSSEDGASWQAIASKVIEGGGFNGRIMKSEGKYIAFSYCLGANGGIYTSLDAVNWHAAYIDQATYLFSDGAWDGERFIAIGGKFGGGVMAESSDLETWKSATFGDATPNFWSAAWGGGKVVAVGEYEYGGAIFTSDDGKEWTRRDPGVNTWLMKVIWDGHQFIAVGYFGIIMTSPDGIRWSVVFYGKPYEWIEDVLFDGKLYIAVGGWDRGDGEGETTVLTSYDGQRWERGQVFSPFQLKAVASSGKRYVAVGRRWSWNGGPLNLIICSEDGIAWRLVQNSLNFEDNDIVWNGSKFLAAGHPNAMMESPDGITWTRLESPSFYVWGLFWDGGRFYAAGDGVMSSLDGRIWDVEVTGVNPTLREISYNGTTYFCVGESGAIVTRYCGPLKADTSAEPGQGLAPLDVQFTAEADGGSSPYNYFYEWDFGDGSPVSHEQNPPHEYFAAGVFNWIITVTDGGGGVYTSSGTVEVLSPCSLKCTANAEPSIGTAPLAVAFSSSAQATSCQGSPSFSWIFGDGGVSSEQNPAHIYLLPGVYQWTLSVSADDLTCSREGTITVTAPPCILECSATPSVSSGRAPLAVTFSAETTALHCSSDTAYHWITGDGAASDQQVFTHTFASQGDYNWSLEVSVDGETCMKGGKISVAPGIPGDCDGDGAVSVAEVQGAINMFLGLAPPACNVDCDGRGPVTIADIQKVINAFLGFSVVCQ